MLLNFSAFKLIYVCAISKTKNFPAIIWPWTKLFGHGCISSVCSSLQLLDEKSVFPGNCTPPIGIVIYVNPNKQTLDSLSWYTGLYISGVSWQNYFSLIASYKMPPSLAEVVAHPIFLSFLATAASWRERVQLQDVFSRVLLALNNTNHSLAVVCSVNKVAVQFSKLVKKAPFHKKSFSIFLEKKHEWLASTVFPEDCCQVAVEEEQEVLLEQEVLKEQEMPQEQDEEEGDDDVFHPEEEDTEPAAKKMKTRSTQTDEAKKMMAPRKRNKPYSKSSNSMKCRTMKKFGDIFDSFMDTELEGDLSKKLKQRGKKRSRGECDSAATEDFFDEHLSVFNLICNAQLSMNAYTYLRTWVRDYARRGGDLLKLPSSPTLQLTRDKMVPPGLTVTATEARFPLQKVLDCTSHRLLDRPDIVDYLDQLEDGATLEMLWKWGMDGQTGESESSTASSLSSLPSQYLYDFNNHYHNH